MEKFNFKELAFEWLSLRQLSIKHSTYVKYENVIIRHIIPFFENYHFKEISNQNIILFFEEKKKGKLSNSTLNSIKSILAAIIEYGVENYAMDHINFKRIKISSVNKTKKVLSNEDREKIIQYVQENNNSLSVAMLLALYGGLRLGEICALKWKHVEFDNQVLHIEGTALRLKCKENKVRKTEIIIQSPKSCSSCRDVPIPQFILNYIQRLNVFDEDSYILSGDHKIYEPRRLEKNFKKFCNDNDISCNFHNLRHSYATDCVRNNVEIKILSEILGHSNVSITLNLYVHTSLEQKKKEICKIKTPSIFVD